MDLNCGQCHHMFHLFHYLNIFQFDTYKVPSEDICFCGMLVNCPYWRPDCTKHLTMYLGFADLVQLRKVFWFNSVSD